jgi:hypothetical protein
MCRGSSRDRRGTKNEPGADQLDRWVWSLHLPLEHGMLVGLLFKSREPKFFIWWSKGEDDNVSK